MNKKYNIIEHLYELPSEQFEYARIEEYMDGRFILDLPSNYPREVKEVDHTLDGLMYFMNGIPKFTDTIKITIGRISKPKYRVQFNDKKGATTLIEDNNIKPKVTVVKTCKGDEFDKKYGFLLAYFQHNSGMSKTQSNKYLKNLAEEDNE